MALGSNLNSISFKVVNKVWLPKEHHSQVIEEYIYLLKSLEYMGFKVHKKDIENSIFYSLDKPDVIPA